MAATPDRILMGRKQLEHLRLSDSILPLTFFLEKNYSVKNCYALKNLYKQKGAIKLKKR
jgi:hypothetical protein